MKAVFDSNIVIDYLNGFERAENVFEEYPEKIISIVTWIEVLVGIEKKFHYEKYQRFLV